MTHLGEFEKTNDTEGASMIRSSCIACLAHLAALYHSVGDIQPSARATMNVLCDVVLGNLGSLTQDMKLEEVTYFDLLLKVSNSRVLLHSRPHRLIFIFQSIPGQRRSKSTIRGSAASRSKRAYSCGVGRRLWSRRVQISRGDHRSVSHRYLLRWRYWKMGGLRGRSIQILWPLRLEKAMGYEPRFFVYPARALHPTLPPVHALRMS